MLSALTVPEYVLPPPSLHIEASPHREEPASGLMWKLAKLAEAPARARVRLAEQQDRLDSLYRQAEQQSGSPDDLEAVAQAVRVQELKAAEMLVPQIEGLRKRLSEARRNNASAMQSWRRIAEECLEISISWLELYQNLQIRLYKLASDRRSMTEPSSPVFDDAGAATEYLRKLVAE